jgi:tetratricopeptide (TPR) repeat protein
VARAGAPAELRAGLALQVGGSLLELGRNADAIVTLERARAIWQRELDTSQLDYARVLNTLANALNYTGRPHDAIALYREALAIRHAALGPTHPELGPLWENLAGALLDVGQVDDARAGCRRAGELARSDLMRAGTLRCRARAERLAGALEEAHQLLEQALALMGSSEIGGHRNYAWIQIGDLAVDRGEAEAALAWCQRAESALGNHPDAILAIACRGRALALAGKHDEARTLLERAYSTREGQPAQWRGDVQLALAHALPASEAARVRALATAARSDYADANDQRGLARVDEFLAGRRN